MLKAAHAYQCGASRQELAPHFHVTDTLIARCPNLLIVSSHGAGYDTVDVDACTKAGILVLNQSGGNAQSVAEHALGMMLSLSKKIVQVDKALRRGGLSDRTAFKGTEVYGKTVGIIGLGNVGRRLAAMCKAALNMRVLAYDPYLDAATISARGGEKVSLEQLLAQSDFVSISVRWPRTAESCSVQRNSRRCSRTPSSSRPRVASFMMRPPLLRRCATRRSQAPASTSGKTSRRPQTIR